MEEVRYKITDLGRRVLVEYFQSHSNAEGFEDTGDSNYVMGIVISSEHPKTYEKFRRYMTDTLKWNEDKFRRAFSNAFEAGYIDYEERV